MKILKNLDSRFPAQLLLEAEIESIVFWVRVTKKCTRVFDFRDNCRESRKLSQKSESQREIEKIYTKKYVFVSF